MNSTEQTNTGQLRGELERLKPGDAVIFEVERQGRFQFIAFEME